MNRLLVILMLAAWAATWTPHWATAQDTMQRSIEVLIRQRCFDCHDGEEAEGEMDLAALLKATSAIAPADAMPDELSETWLKVEKAVTQLRMPPDGEEPLDGKQRDSLMAWFHSRIVLKQGKPHIGTTPLRRLTHYEFLNSLEDLLGVSVRAEYNILSSVNVEKGFVEKVLPVEAPGESGFVNDAKAQASQPLPLLEYMKCVDFALSKISRNEQSLEKLFGFRQIPAKLTESQTRDTASKFLRRALRGRSSDQHVARAVAVYQKAAAERGVLSSLKAMMRTILLLPEFYYRLETRKGLAAPYAVTDLELATRLAYFLNGSTPDDELLAVAEAGKLTDPKVLEQQASRLLNRRRRISLSERFAAQWIGFEQLVSEADVDERGVPTINRAQYDELLYFFDEIFRSDLSLLDIIESDWAYVSKYNAGTYGRGQFKGRKPFAVRYADVLNWRRLTGSQRRGIENIYDPPTLQAVASDRYGGVITSAAVMRITSAPERTSPVRRGVWLLDTLIGEKLEAPKNVPPIDNAIQSLPSKNPGKLEIIKAHTEMASCKLCHKDIDPLGFGLENFDPAGRWRTKYRDKSDVVSAGKLPGGKSFSSPKQLKQQLLDVYREKIVRNFIRRMLSYAIGRSLKPYDRPTIDEIYKRVVDGDYRSSIVIREIIRSPQFLCRQDAG